MSPSVSAALGAKDAASASVLGQSSRARPFRPFFAGEPKWFRRPRRMFRRSLTSPASRKSPAGAIGDLRFARADRVRRRPAGVRPVRVAAGGPFFGEPAFAFLLASLPGHCWWPGRAGALVKASEALGHLPLLPSPAGRLGPAVSGPPLQAAPGHLERAPRARVTACLSRPPRPGIA